MSRSALRRRPTPEMEPKLRTTARVLARATLMLALVAAGCGVDEAKVIASTGQGGAGSLGLGGSALGQGANPGQSGMSATLGGAGGGGSTLPTAFSLDSLRPAPTAPAYYVDAVHGVDTADGRSPATAWKTLGRLHQVVLVPGDVVRLARGSVWDQQHLLFDNQSAGSAIAPVVIEAYGTGASPTISNPRALWDVTKPFAAVYFAAGSNYITVLDLHVRDGEGVAGFYLTETTHHLVVAGCEAERLGVGISLSGTHQRLLANSVHDIGVTGTGSGIGIGIVGSDLELGWNRIANCRIMKPEGEDGGAIEYYGRKVSEAGVETFDLSDDIRIHHNTIDNCYDFMESYGNVTRLLISYNLYQNSENEALEFHLDDSEHATWTHDCSYEARIENNTFVPVQKPNPGGWGIIGLLVDWNHAPDPAKSKIVVRNNIFVTNYKVTSSNPLGSNHIHDHNLYQFVGAGKLSDKPESYVLDPTESVGDPKFVDFAGKDYRLTSGSPAIDRGAPASASVDLLGGAVPVGVAPDLGAIEWH